MKTSITHSEEFQGMTTLFLSNSHQISFPTERLINYIVANELNISTEAQGGGLTSDPYANEVEVTVEIDAEVYLDTEWDNVVEKYYTNVVLKSESKLVTI